jgi:hypothetical protein
MSLKEDILNCSKCSRKSEKRFIGMGAFPCSVLFIVDRPNKEGVINEQEQLFLTELAEFLGVGSDDYAIVSMFKCSGNSDRTDFTCLNFLKRQLDLISAKNARPLVILFTDRCSDFLGFYRYKNYLARAVEFILLQPVSKYINDKVATFAKIQALFDPESVETW